MLLKATTRTRITNKVFLATFVVAFLSVAALPCPAHSAESETKSSPPQEARPNRRDESTVA